MQRLFILIGGLAGGGGVALSAVAAHAGGDYVATASSFLMAHAPTLLAIGLLGRGLVLATGGAVLVVGLLLFCGDLLMRYYLGDRLFPMAAPTGGTLMIIGWVVVALSAFATRREP